MLPLIGLFIGVVVGVLMPFNIPSQYSKYVAVAILACLDSLLGGMVASAQNKFNLKIFLTGFFGNSLLAGALAFVGDRMGLELYLAAVFAFGNRLFLNFATFRRLAINRFSRKDTPNS